VRFGGACTDIRSPKTSRVAAIARIISACVASSCERIGVSGFARKFWTMTSWICAGSSDERASAS
jgi:hypothetical protein